MTDIPQISEAEWEVMKVIWANSSCTANEVVEKLEGSTDWKPKTIKTLINRLAKKGVIDYTIDESDKKTYHYFAKALEDECIKAESNSFLKRVFNGSLNAMLANFLSESETKLSEKEIDELKQILDKKKD